MKFLRKKIILVGMLSSIFLFAMFSSAFCETPGIPPGFEDIEAQILASPEALTSSIDVVGGACRSCHTPDGENGYLAPHHTWLPNTSIPGDLGDPSDPHNPYCPEVTPGGCGWLGCHAVYDENCSTKVVLITDGCASCHSLSPSCGWEMSPPVQCFQIGPCAGGTQTPPELVEELVNIVIVLNLQQGISNALDAKLDTALSALDDMNTNNDVAAINSLNAFINSVDAQRGNKISDEDADTLIAAAQAIIDALEGL